MAEAAIRDDAGRFLPGQSGNPGGQSRETALVKRIAQKHGSEMIQALVDIVRDQTAPHAARVAAAREVLDRGFGRPEQNIDVRLQMQKLEILLQAKTDTMSDDDLALFAERWDALMVPKVIEHALDLEATDITET